MNKWVSIQSLLAQEEDKHKESSANTTASTNNKESNDTPPEKTLTVQTVKPTDQIKDQKPKLISKNSKINNNVVQEQQTLDCTACSVALRLLTDAAAAAKQSIPVFGEST